MKKDISKNNYSWFQDGRYALLWDVTFPETGPKHFIGINGSTWDVYVSDCRNGKKPGISEKVLLFAFVKGDGSGGLILRGSQILSFRGHNLWIHGFSGMEEKLGEIILKRTNVLNKTESKKLVDACIAVSDDPHKGAAIVIMKEGLDNPFKPMGKLWGTANAGKLESISVPELISLMAMDGATCIYRNEGEGNATLAFRCPLKSPTEGDPQTISFSSDLDRFLDGEGSRKWSAAMAACRPDVVLAIVISQDGPVRIFFEQGGEVCVIDPAS